MGSPEIARHLVLRPQAQADIADAVDWYRERGLAPDFLHAVDAALAEVQRNPFLYQALVRGIRRVPLHRFPYGLMYVVREEELVVLTCFHDRRNPRHWRDLPP